mmetsp:Transcript_14712/g.16841  ORF Transcript_14712/g.16841 Transcript_14712/m.16841 type:complete len:453 (-) Transcript_14712:84-1442(-)|eukprot:CAMPEP_0194138072 /NCGR_PEP_ID=MMETSP0152-20130528/7920_1 /TAXON_ID=1049557 /ORGANISM="Thalassiothrix antarctica, Strain L6-D1" /LENGTH=452 /DNA_ID=CAMNT_0038835395 /DNA_START=153 /DNA_END=1511 /DNA_ORIENTATION=+
MNLNPLESIISESDTDTASTQGSTIAAMSDEPLQREKKETGKESSSIKFRPYQAEKWQERFDELLEFRKENNHCLVPHTFPTNPGLARWVKRQRYQYTLFQQNKKASINVERIKILDNIGFIWDSHEATWQERLGALNEFKKEHGHCEVPSKYELNAQLATWVKCQRRQYKLYLEGQPSNITEERIAELERYGFKWEIRKSKTFELRKSELIEQKAKVSDEQSKLQKIELPTHIPNHLLNKRKAQQSTVDDHNTSTAHSKIPRSASDDCVKVRIDDFIIGSDIHVPEENYLNLKSKSVNVVSQKETQMVSHDNREENHQDSAAVSVSENQDQQHLSAVVVPTREDYQRGQGATIFPKREFLEQLHFLTERVSALENVVKMQQDLIEELSSQDKRIMENDRTMCTKSVLKYMTRDETPPSSYNYEEKKRIPHKDMETAATLIKLTVPTTVDRQ